jgi:aryl-alcohol dehydrogenase (NADP+)
MTFGLQCDEEQSFTILDRAVEAGITFLDSADVYPLGGGPSTAGRTEEIVGKWMRSRRDDVIIATKCFGAMSAKAWDRGQSRKHIREAVEGSLRRLGVETIDLYQLHADDLRTPLDETLGALDDLVRSGKIMYAGCSNWSAWRLALATGRASGTRLDSVQPRYNLVFRPFERDLFPLCEAEGIGMIPYNPLAGGLLTGKHRRESKPGDGRFTLGNAGQMYRARYWHDEEFDIVDALRPLADGAGISLAHLAIGWVLAKPFVTAPIIGASKPEQLDDALAAVEKPLDPALVAKLDELTAKFRLSDAPR